MIPIQPMVFESNNEYWIRLIVLDIAKDRYMISTHGNIYDVIENKLVIPNYNDRYPYIFLLSEKDNRRHRYQLHRLMALSFIFEKDPNRIFVNHIDGDKTNPNVNNLEWTTAKENTVHAVNNGLFRPNPHNTNKLNKEMVEIICEMLQDGKSYTEILSAIGLDDNRNTRELIGNIYRRKSWTKVSSNYTFPTYDRKVFNSHDIDSIKRICEYLEKGSGYKEIVEGVFGIKYEGSLKNKKEYELIRRIKDHQIFTSISKDYNF